MALASSLHHFMPATRRQLSFPSQFTASHVFLLFICLFIFSVVDQHNFGATAEPYFVKLESLHLASIGDHDRRQSTEPEYPTESNVDDSRPVMIDYDEEDDEERVRLGEYVVVFRKGVEPDGEHAAELMRILGSEFNVSWTKDEDSVSRWAQKNKTRPAESSGEEEEEESGENEDGDEQDVDEHDDSAPSNEERGLPMGGSSVKTGSIYANEDHPHVVIKLPFAAAHNKTARIRLLERLRNESWIDFIEPVRLMRNRASGATEQLSAPWNLDRIDQRDGTDGKYSYEYTGSAVHVYVIDTGVLPTHSDFGGRADNIANFVGGSNDDCNGHGTHVAGTVGSTTYGVAKGVSLHGIKVLNCDGDGDSNAVVSGLNWVASNHQKPAVATLSLGGSPSTIIDTAVKNLIAQGVTVVVAAGNQNSDACQESPARVPEAITVAASDSSDTRASFSNWGYCVDTFAPGKTILSTWYSSTTATNTLSGTSMATPHVAGVAATFLEQKPTATTGEVRAAIVDGATMNKVINTEGSPNLLLYSQISPDSTEAYPCPSCQVFNGTVNQKTGLWPSYTDTVWEPAGTYYTVDDEAASGYHRGYLRYSGNGNPADYDFDLFLYQWTGTKWAVVAQSTGPTASESLLYSGGSGNYIWAITSNKGSGDYSFFMMKPYRPDYLEPSSASRLQGWF